MTAVKVGSVYKVQFEDKAEQGMLVGISEGYRGQNYLFLYVDGTDQQVRANDVTLSSTRIKPEVRQYFKKIFNMYKEKEKLKQQRDELNMKISSICDNITSARKEMKDVNGVYSAEDVVNTFNRKYETDTYLWGTKDGNLFFSVDQHHGKYVRPRDYSFIDYEYDSTLWISDYEQAKKKLCVTISKQDLDNLKSKLKLAKFVKTTESVDIGDKNTLSSSTTFHFKVRPQLSKEEMDLVAKEIYHAYKAVEKYESSYY